jgi:hypothetical protein
MVFILRVGYTNQVFYMNAIQKLKSLPHKTFAHLLIRVQNSSWWKESLIAESNKISNQRIEAARALLPQRSGDNDWTNQVFENLVAYMTSEQALHKIQEPINQHMLNFGALVIKNLTPLNQLIPIVALHNPVSNAMLMRANNSGNTTSKSYEVLKVVVDAVTRKLNTKLNREGLIDTDLSYLEGSAQEAAGDIMKLVIDQLKMIAGEPDVLNIEQWMSGEVGSKLLQVIDTNVQRLAIDTGRTPTVVIHTSKEVAEILIEQNALDLNEYASLVPTNMDFVGKLKSSGNKVYVTPHIGKGEILIAYKTSSNMDSGCIFMPYMPVVKSGLVMDQATFVPSETFITRYALASDKDSKKYYRLIDASKVLSHKSV